MKYALTIVVILVAVMLLFGCTGQNDIGNKTPTGTGANSQIQTPGINKDNKTVVASDNKTGQQKMQETINQAIADGTYSSNVTYAYHSGSETVNISVTVENDTIKAATVTVGQTNQISTKIINNFNNALPELVVGKKITELNIPKNVAGSSLTTAAFKQYVEKIVQEN
ncbi:hypothetical protein HY990_01070 [Candidatus Micrarchaeota archaeon]|nr:hypothetical protein [Candidatus Micrarchaeota archaeon]